jgi:hypothetical protein
MAEIVRPGEIQQPRLGAGGLLRPRELAAPFEAAERAVRDIGDALDQVAEEQEQFRRSTELGRAKALYLRDITGRQIELQDDDDPATRTERFVEYAQSRAREYSEQFTDSQLREIFELDASAKIQAKRLSVFQKARRDEIDALRNEMADSLQVFANEADFAERQGNISGRDHAILDALEMINTNVLLDENEKGTARRAFLAEVDSRRILRLTREAIEGPDLTVEDMEADLKIAKQELDKSLSLDLLQRERLEAGITRAQEAGVRKVEVEAARRERQADEERIQRERDAADGYLQRIYLTGEAPGVELSEIVVDPDLGPRSREHLSELLLRKARGEEINQPDYTKVNDLYRRVYYPTHPNPITDSSELMIHLGRGLPIQDYRTLKADLDARKTEQRKAWDDQYALFLDGVRPFITDSVYGQRWDRVGEHQFYQFQREAKTLYDQAIEQGEDPRHTVLNPHHESYLGKIVGPFILSDHEKQRITLEMSGMIEEQEAEAVAESPDSLAADVQNEMMEYGLKELRKREEERRQRTPE